MPTNLKDSYDLPVSTHSQKALDRYVEGVATLLAQNSGHEDALSAAIEADEGFALAHIALAPPLQLAGRADEARQVAARARELVAGATRRERQHVEAIAASIDGDTQRSVELLRQHLDEFPQDALVLQRSSAVITNSGTASRKEEAFDFLRRYGSDHEGEAWFLASYAFAHNELFYFEDARRLVDRSYELDPKSCSCAHSMAHVMYETGDHASGASFLEGWLDGSPWQTNFAGHLTWHRALCELGRGRFAEMLSLYDSLIRPRNYPGGRARTMVVDGASLLWRCELHGLQCPEEAPGEVVERAFANFPRSGHAFIDVHKALALALRRDFDGLDKLANEERKLVRAGKQPSGPAVPAIIEAVGAFARGDYDDAVRTLEPVADEIGRVGGSHAQYEVFHDTLIAACMRSGRVEQAATLLRERLERRPSRQDDSWLRALEAVPINQK